MYQLVRRIFSISSISKAIRSNKVCGDFTIPRKKTLPNQNYTSKHVFSDKNHLSHVIICPPKTSNLPEGPPVTKTVFFWRLAGLVMRRRERKTKRRCWIIWTELLRRCAVDGWIDGWIAGRLVDGRPLRIRLCFPKKGISPNQSRDGIHPCKVLNRDLVPWAWRSRLVSRHIWLMMWWNLDETHMISFIQTNPIDTPCVTFFSWEAYHEGNSMGSLP